MHFGVGGHAEVVAHGGGDIQTSGFVMVVFGAFVTKDVFPVVGGEGPAILPLGVADFFAVNDLKPAAFACALARAFVWPALPPRDDAACMFTVFLVVQAVVIRKGDVEWVEFRGEGLGPVLDAGAFIRVVVAAVIVLPLGIP